jgi:predicted alpha/beta superfamily hydrolase
MRTLKTLICLLMLPCLSQAQKTIALGTSYEIRSAQLNEQRTINIYLPDGYADSTAKRYDVIYLLDGGVDEDYIHFCGLVQYFSFPWLNTIPQAIVVGIANTDRKRDMTFPTTVKKDKEQWPTTGGSAKFMSFLERDLFPYIEQHYRTNGSRTLSGESLAGLFACEVLLKKPAMFNNFLIISPSLWWDNGSLLKSKTLLSSAIPAAKTRVYIGVGKEGLAPTADPHVMEVDANVLADQIKKLNNPNIQLYFDYYPQYDHASIAHYAMYEGLMKLFAR